MRRTIAQAAHASSRAGAGDDFNRTLSLENDATGKTTYTHKTHPTTPSAPIRRSALRACARAAARARLLVKKRVPPGGNAPRT